MGKEICRNYLDIQLRDMDYLNRYGSDIRGAFLDPQNVYESNGYFEKKYKAALNSAISVLDLHRAQTVVTDNPVIQTLIGLYRERLRREVNFIREFEKNYKVKWTGTFPRTGNYHASENIKYARFFSEYIQSMVGDSDDPIVSTLRSENFAVKIGGKLSSVWSTAAARRVQSTEVDQSDINLYYENLFNTFFFGSTANNGVQKSTLGRIGRLLNHSAGEKAFKEKFKQFTDTYYRELFEGESKNREEMELLIDSLDAAAIKGIYQSFYKNNPKNFIFKKGQDRGVSKNTEHQLKSMLLATLRQLAEKSGKSYSDFSIPNLLQVNADWKQTSNGYHGEVQIKIDEGKAQRKEQLASIEQRKRKGEKVDKRTYNRTYLVKHEDDLLETDDGMKTSKQIFLDYMIKQISEEIGRSMTKDEIDCFSRAVFQKIDKTIKRGEKFYQTLSTYGPTQLKGFLGEIATAYAIQSSKIFNSGVGSKRTAYTEITGASRNKLGQQIHYDVVARIKDMHIGFQVKNYGNIEKGANLYGETLGMGTKDMYKFFGTDTQKYRWLFANGRFISNYDGMPDLKQKLEDSLYNYTSNFLRITDAEASDMIESDIYVLGKFYVPSSYLIACAIDRVERDLEGRSDVNKLFEIQGDFPKYRKKANPYPNGDIDPSTGEITEPDHRTENSKYNLLSLNDSHIRGYVLGKAKIAFSGLHIQFTI